MSNTLLADCLNLMRELSIYCDGIIESFPTNKDKQIGFTIVVYFKIINIFQGIIILFQNNLYQPAEQLLRCCLETTCILLISIENKVFLHQYDLYENTYQECQRLKTFKALGNTEINGAKINNEIKKIEKRIKDEKIINLTSNYLLKTSGLHKDFKVPYHILSESIHSNLGDLSRHLLFDDDGKWIGACSQPVLDENNKLALQLTATNLIIICLKHFSSFLGLKNESKIEYFESSFLSIDQKLSELIREKNP